MDLISGMRVFVSIADNGSLAKAGRELDLSPSVVSKHISALTAAGGDAVAVISNISVGADQIIKSILDTGVFDKFILPEEMIDNKIISQFKQERLKKSFGYLQVFSNLGSKKFINLGCNIIVFFKIIFINNIPTKFYIV